MFLSFKSEWVCVVWVSPNPFFLLQNIRLHRDSILI